MLKENICNLKRIRTIAESDFSKVIELDDDRVLKILDPLIFNSYLASGYSMEEKLMISEEIKGMNNLYKPLSIVYSPFDECVGYTTKKSKGRNYNDSNENISDYELTDLHRYAFIHSRIASVVKEGNEQGIVFPDLCTDGNIFIDKAYNMEILDYDGFQIKQFPATTYSDAIGNEHKYDCPKFRVDEKFFTPEIDKVSLLYHYFLDAFSVDLKKVGQTFPDGRIITVKDIFDIINLDDEIFMNKVEAILSNDRPGEFIDQDIFRIADNYDLHVLAKIERGYIKKLTRK